MWVSDIPQLLVFLPPARKVNVCHIMLKVQSTVRTVEYLRHPLVAEVGKQCNYMGFFLAWKAHIFPDQFCFIKLYCTTDTE